MHEIVSDIPYLQVTGGGGGEEFNLVCLNTIHQWTNEMGDEIKAITNPGDCQCYDKPKRIDSINCEILPQKTLKNGIFYRLRPWCRPSYGVITQQTCLVSQGCGWLYFSLCFVLWWSLSVAIYQGYFSPVDILQVFCIHPVCILHKSVLTVVSDSLI